MSEAVRTPVHAAPAAKAQDGNRSSLRLQRQCACGSRSSSAGGECEGCRRKRTTGLQAKLQIGSSTDRLELEADRIAEQVLGMPGARVSGAAAGHVDAPPRIQRATAAMPDAALADAPPIVDDVLRSPGRPMDATTRSYFEPRFGHDFGRVRVHDDTVAAESAEAVNALAYTIGEHVVFGRNQLAPHTPGGQRLLAHELTHVVQQSGIGTGRTARLMRKACGHDGAPTGCGGVLGKIKFPGESLSLDKTVVEKGLNQHFPGKWMTEVPSPPNPSKSGKEGGRIDGMRVSVKGGLQVEVVEVKPRSTGGLFTEPTGGCAQATTEAQGYVSELQKLAPKLKAMSEKFSKIGGYRLLDKLTPKTKVERDVFATVGIDIDNEEWLQAWKFYNSIQQKWPTVFKKPFESVAVSLFSEGDTKQAYDAFGWLVKCKDNKAGTEKLGFMVNKAGGVSYGCEKDCDQDRKKNKKQKEQVDRIGTTVMEQPRRLQLTSLDPELREVEPRFREAIRMKGVLSSPGSNYLIIAPPSFYRPMVAEPRMERQLEHMRTHAMDASRNPHLGLRNLGWTMVGLYAGATAVIFYGGAVAALGAGGAAAPAALPAALPAAAPAAAPATAGGGAVIVRSLVSVAANDNAVKAVAAAASVLFVVATTSGEAEAATVTDVDAVIFVEKSQVKATEEGSITFGSEVEFDGKRYHVIGSATAQANE